MKYMCGQGSHTVFGDGAGAQGIGKFASFLLNILYIYEVFNARLIPIVNLTL